MIKIFFSAWLSLIVMMSSFSCFAFSEPQPFTKAKLEVIKQQYLGKQWLMILWSVDCPACFKELALIQKIRETKPDLNVVIINADDNDEINEERQKVMALYGLSTLTNLYFNDGEGDQARYIIDKSWYGELPRSYFVDTNGKFHGKSGLVNEKLIRKWLVDG